MLLTPCALHASPARSRFIKANAINSAQVRAQRQEEKRDAQSQAHDAKDFEKYDAHGQLKSVGKVTTSAGYDAKKDQELNLQEFLNMLVRIGFWRANPTFGLHDSKAELVPVGLALSTMLNEIILPNAKRENSAEFRVKEMQDKKLLAVLGENTHPQDEMRLASFPLASITAAPSRGEPAHPRHQTPPYAPVSRILQTNTATISRNGTIRNAPTTRTTAVWCLATYW